MARYEQNESVGRAPRLQAIQHILTGLCQEQGFTAAVLVSSEGFSLAAMPATSRAEAVAAVVAQWRKAIGQAQKQLQWPALDEVNLVSPGGARLVGCCFAAGGQDLILAVVVPDRRPYRRATQQALRAIQQAWTTR